MFQDLNREPFGYCNCLFRLPNHRIGQAKRLEQQEGATRCVRSIRESPAARNPHERRSAQGMESDAVRLFPLIFILSAR